MSADKTVNYTADQVKVMVDTYTANPTDATVAALAAQFGKSTRSVVAKLAQVKAYIAKTKVSTTTATTKADMAGRIAKELSLEVDKLPNLEKLTKAELNAILIAVRNLREPAEDFEAQ